jgi:acyl-CoA dehydrogenase
MAFNFHFDPVDLPPECKALRQEVRAFLRAEIAAGSFSPDSERAPFETARAFARKVGARGWIGMTWPKKYGGHERSHLERYVVIEEMLAHRAPTRSYSTADRQSGPVILRYGQEAIRETILPRIASGELCFCIGLSEPNSGSDVFAASTRATKTDGGWLVNGRKIWTSNAHNSDYMIALLRTSPKTKENHRHGLTQFLIALKTPGITTRPIINLTGSHEFNEVVFDDAFVPDLHLIGEVDMAWKQATDELAYERSGPDRWLETFPALVELVRRAGPEPSERLAEGIGREVAHLATLRRMSVSVAGMLQAGKTPAVEAAAVKDLGTNWEQALPNKVRLLAPPTGDSNPESNDDRFEEALRHTTLIAPKLTIQGGTREVLRGIIARGLGLR